MGSMHKASRKLSSALHLRRRLRRVGGWIGDHVRHDTSSSGHHLSIDNVIGIIRIRVKRGINLVVRDTVSDSSDPYIVFTLGYQKLKTRVVKKNCNPVWNDELTLCVTDPDMSIFLTVYDKDTLSGDDKMGDAEIDLKPIKCMAEEDLEFEKLPSPTTLFRVQPSRDNCVADESCIVWENGKIVQDMLLRLRNVTRGQIQLQIEWIPLPPQTPSTTTS